MDNDYYQSLDNEIKLNGGAVDVTPNDVSIENFSEIPAPTPTSINDTQSNSSCPIEKPYYETNESIQKPQFIQPIIQQKNCCTRCQERYDDISIYLIRILLILFIQFALITSIFFVLFYFDIYETHLKNNSGILFFLTNTIVCCLCYGVLCIKGSCRRNSALYIYILLYIPSILFNCFFFVELTEIRYVSIILITILGDYFSLLIFIISFTAKNFLFFIAPIITSTASMLTFHFMYNLSTEITIKISLVALSAIIYIVIILLICLYQIEMEDYLFAAIIMNYAIFSPIALAVFLAVALILLVLFLAASANR
jgi:hypothetical protein